MSEFLPTLYTFMSELISESSNAVYAKDTCS